MRKPIIYICEDDLALAQYIERLLKEEGYDTHCFYDGGGLARAISDKIPDVLVLDVQLPGEDGIALAQRYSAAMPGVKIIMMSVLRGEAVRHSGYNAGAMVFLPKPFDPIALLACLQGLFAHKQQSVDAVMHISNRTLSAGGLSVGLTQSELILLRELALENGEVVGYYRLIEALDSTLNELSKSSLEVCVSRMRKKIKPLQDYTDLQVRNKTNGGYFLQGNLVLEDS